VDWGNSEAPERHFSVDIAVMSLSTEHPVLDAYVLIESGLQSMIMTCRRCFSGGYRIDCRASCTVHPQTTPVPHRRSSSREVSGPCLNVNATTRGSGASAIRMIAHGGSVIPGVGRCPARPHGGGLHLSGN
jgi:hypothetical protein